MDNALRGQEWAQTHLDKATAISFPNAWSSEERTVAGDFIAKAVLRAPSSDSSAVFTLENAVVLGGLELQSAVVRTEICFRKCAFIGPVSMRETGFAHRLRFIECVFQDEVRFAACSTSDLWFAAELELSETTPKLPGAVFHRALCFFDSKIVGNLCLDNASFDGGEPSSLNGVVVDGSVFIRGARFQGAAIFVAIRIGYSFYGDGSRFINPNERADFSNARIANSLSFSDAVFEGPADFANVDIGTNFVCTRTRFLSREKTANFNSMTVRGHAVFDEAVFNSQVDLVAAKVHGSLMLRKARLCGAEASASFNSAEIGGHALFTETIFHGSVDFGVTKVTGTFDFRKAQVLSERLLANFSGLKVGDHALFGEAAFRGPASFSSAQFAANLDLTRAQFLSADGVADFSTTAIKGTATFAEAVFHGSVTFAFAEIDGLFNLQSAQFLSDKAAVNIQAVRARNIVWLADAKFHGAVSLALAEIGGSLRCERTEFLNPTLVMEANAFKVKGHVSFADAKFHGPADFRLIEVDGQLICDRAMFLNPQAVAAFDSCIIRGSAEFSKAIFHGPALFTSIRIAGHVIFNSAEFRSRTDFNSARIESWALFNEAQFGDAAGFPYLNVGAAAEFNGALFKGPVNFTWSRVGGNLMFSRASAEKGARAATFDGLVDLTGASVGGKALFDGVICNGTAVFSSMSVRGGAGFNKAEFKGDAKLEHFAAVDAYFTLALFGQASNFTGLHLKGSGYFTGARFMAATSFQDCVVEGDLKFEAAAGDPPSGQVSAVFQGPVNADGIRVKGELIFSDCSFGLNAELTLRQATIGSLGCQRNQFDHIECFSAELARVLVFINNTVNGDAGFCCLNVHGRAVFNGSVFKQGFDLREAILTGGAYFNAASAREDSPATPCTFEGVTKFDRSRFNGPVRFGESVFQRRTSFAATHFLSEVWFGNAADARRIGSVVKISFGDEAEFEHAVFGGPASFFGVEFSGPARFSKSQFQNRVMFNGVNFKDRSDGSAVFAEADFQSQALFLNSTVEGRLAFYGAKSQHILGIWSSCRFNGSVDSRNAKLSILMIESDGPEPSDMSFLGTLKLNGCTYQRITCPEHLGLEALWATICNSVEGRSGERTLPDFDRQPYLQFERFCRGVGKNELADTVYFDLRRNEGEFERRRMQRFWGAFERLVFGYGVKPFRMLCWFLVALFGGALVFSLPTNIEAAPARFLGGLGVSLGNLIPGLTSLLGSAAPESDRTVGIAVALFQRCFGAALLALLAERFFKGLKR